MSNLGRFRISCRHIDKHIFRLSDALGDASARATATVEDAAVAFVCGGCKGNPEDNNDDERSNDGDTRWKLRG
eukprot:2913371-Alexandrium_andersonii.AAC.1